MLLQYNIFLSDTKEGQKALLLMYEITDCYQQYIYLS
jgi:hypothetical protein